MIVGLTGGIGSGKSTVAKLFNLLGWKHFSSDVAAKNLYFESEIKEKAYLKNAIVSLLKEEEIRVTKTEALGSSLVWRN